jgi:arylsulfatase A-like enzyme
MIPSRDEVVYNERPSYGEAVVPADSTTGTHSRDGILIAWGSGIRPQAHFVQNPNLRDVGPTALASLGCPLSEDMDGRPIEELFAGGVEVKRQGSSYRDEPAASDAVYSIGEENQLRERLRGLGYIE